MPTSPFYLADLPALREKLARAERDGTLLGRVWDSVRRRARLAPEGHPWFTPFVALVTGEERDLEPARAALRNYRAALESKQFSSLVHFHFWCAAFPHARWTVYFQWLASLGAWEPAEQAALGEDLLTFAFTNFFYGLRTKPDPECVDNQGLSLAFCTALVGRLFSHELGASAVAARMAREAFSRIPVMLAGLPPSGYSGEGSTYMSGVVGPSLPFLVELLVAQHGGDWFSRSPSLGTPLPLREGGRGVGLPSEPPLPQAHASWAGEGAGDEASPQNPPPVAGGGQGGGLGATPAAVFRMLARLRLPGGLLLPWDHYGYVLPSHSYIAYAAHRTGDPFYRELLEHHSDFAVTMNAGWGYDDAVWSLLWWPENQHPLPCQGRGQGVRQSPSPFPSWSAPEVGAALVSSDASLYLMQMWDPAGVPEPGRAHMNPNAVVLSAWNTPLTVDGVPTKECTRFNYDDTWREVHYMAVGSALRYNYGPGCAGSHSVLLVDGEESFRAQSDYRQAELIEADAASVTADVTPLYRERWADTRRVRRRSRLIADRFWLIEDLALFGEEHDLTARWWLRPEVIRAVRGVRLDTPEGVRLHLLPLLGPDDCTLETVAGYPDRLDGRSCCVDFRQRGRECRRLWLAFPENTRREVADLSQNWQAVPDLDASLDLASARAALTATALRLPFTQPAHLLADVPLARRWWYRRELRPVQNPPPVAGGGQGGGLPAWLTLPRMMGAPRVWLDGAEVDLTGTLPRRELLELHIALDPLSRKPTPRGPERGQGVRPPGALEIIVSCESAINHITQDMHDMIRGFSGRPALLVPAAAPGVTSATYENNLVTVTSGDETWTVTHDLMPSDE